MKKLLLPLVVLVIYGTSCLGQFKSYDWPRPEPHSIIPQDFENENAVIISELTHIYNTWDTRQKHYRKIKILTQKGLEEYGNIVIPKFSYPMVNYLDARIIKPDGRVVKFNNKEINKLKVQKENELFADPVYYKITIPGAEVGDEIETIITIEESGFINNHRLFLHTYLPALQSTIKLTTDKNFNMVIRAKNKMPEPSVKKGKEETEYTWSAFNLPDYRNEKNAVLAAELPYVDFVLRSPKGTKMEIAGSTFEWYWYANDRLFQPKGFFPKPNGAYYDELVVPYLSNDRHPYDNFRDFHQKVLSKLEMVHLPENTAANSTSHHLKNKQIDYENYNILLKALFKDLNLHFAYCFARSKFEGPVDEDFLHLNSFTDYFYAVWDDKQEVHFIYPSELRVFKIDELPSYLEGVPIFIVDKKHKKAAVEVKKVEVPPTGTDKNYRNVRVEGKAKLREGTLDLFFKESLSGAFSTEFRGEVLSEGARSYKYAEIIARSRTYKSVSPFVVERNEENFPFIFVYGFQVKAEKAVTLEDTDDEIYALPLKGWFTHFMQKTQPGPRELDYFPDFMYVDVFRYYLTFDEDVELLNGEGLFKKPGQEFGEYTLKAVQINASTILIESTYAVHHLHIPKDKYPELLAMNKAAELVDSFFLKVKAKRSS